MIKVIFMGTPNFSCPTLEELIADPDINIVATYSKEPSISGRGKKINKSPIHQLAEKNNLRILTPKNFKNQNDVEDFINFKADIAVVIAYGLILPETIINATKFGCVNLHPSLLPKYRGAAPVQRTIMNGEKVTANCVIKMDKNIDSGDIINQEIIKIDDKINYQELSDEFSKNGARLIIKSIKELASDQAKLKPQNHKLASYAAKIEKSEAKIDWSQASNIINQKIRALSGNIGAYFLYNNERIKILKAKIVNSTIENKNYGQILNEEMHINCKKGILQPLILQKSGKKAVKLEDFLKGFRVKDLNIL